jgi:hypothetical protein
VTNVDIVVGGPECSKPPPCIGGAALPGHSLLLAVAATPIHPIRARRRTCCRNATSRWGKTVERELTSRGTTCVAPRIANQDYIGLGHIRIPMPNGRAPTENTATMELVATSITLTCPAGVFEAT